MRRLLFCAFLALHGMAASAHDACDKLDCQRLAAKIDKAEAALRRPHNLTEGKKLKADLKAMRAEHWRFCR